MLSRDLGGIQQSFLDYNAIIEQAGFQSISITSKGAKINDSLENNSYHTLPNYFSFDLLSKFLLRRLIRVKNPDYIIAHGKRAITFAIAARRFLGSKVPIIGVAHNYWYKPLLKCDYILSITNHLKDFLLAKGYDPSKIYLMPNCITTISYNFSPKEVSNPNITRIGVLARFVFKKGVDVFIKAMSLLKEQNFEFEAIIGGEGAELDNLKNLVQEHALQNNIKFIGWVNDKNEFFKKIDIFCLPSRHEPFGIIILEAALSKTPIIATRSEGPLEILTHNKDALFVDIESSEQIAESIMILSKNKIISRAIIEAAFLRVIQNYDINSAADRLKNFIKNI